MAQDLTPYREQGYSDDEIFSALKQKDPALATYAEQGYSASEVLSALEGKTYTAPEEAAAAPDDISFTDSFAKGMQSLATLAAPAAGMQAGMDMAMAQELGIAPQGSPEGVVDPLEVAQAAHTGALKDYSSLPENPLAKNIAEKITKDGVLAGAGELVTSPVLAAKYMTEMAPAAIVGGGPTAAITRQLAGRALAGDLATGAAFNAGATAVGGATPNTAAALEKTGDYAAAQKEGALRTAAETGVATVMGAPLGVGKLTNMAATAAKVPLSMADEALQTTAGNAVMGEATSGTEFATSALMGAIGAPLDIVGTAMAKGKDKPLPETPDVLQAQVDAFVEGRKPAVLFTEGAEVPPLPEGAKTAKVPEGVLLYRDDATLELARSGQMAQALGYGVDQKPAGGQLTGVVVARDALGRPVQEVAVDEAGMDAALAAAERTMGEGGTVTVEPLTDVLARRDTPEKQAARAQMNETTDMQVRMTLDEADFDPTLEAALAEVENNPITYEEWAEASRQIEQMEMLDELNREYAPEEENPDIPRGDFGRSRAASESRKKYVNLNDTIELAESFVTVGGGNKVGRPIREVAMKKGEVLGVSAAPDEVDNELYPQAYREAVVETLTQVLQKLGSSAKVLVQFQTLARGDTAKVTPLGNGVYAINPANLTNFSDPAKMNEVTQAEAAYSLVHEVGHLIVWEELQAGMTEEDKLTFDTLGEREVFSEDFLARQTPEVQAVLRDYNAQKARVLSGEMMADEFLQTWLSPAKNAWGIRAKQTRQTFIETAVGQFADYRSLTALQFATSRSIFPEKARVLSPEEWAAEQMARYAHDAKLLEATPLGQQQFFKRVLEKVRAFFKELKIAKVIKAGTAFTEFVDGLVLRKVVIGGRSSKIKFPQNVTTSKPAPTPKAPKANKGKGKIAETVSHNLPEAWQAAPIIEAPKAAKRIPTKAPLNDARGLAIKAVTQDLAVVKEENPDAYKELMELAKTGQFAALREVAEDYVGEEVVGKWRFSTSLPSLDFTPNAVTPWAFRSVAYIQEKGPAKATSLEWATAFKSWTKRGLVKADDYQYSGLQAALEVAADSTKVWTKDEIVQKIRNASGPMEMTVLEGAQTKYAQYRAQGWGVLNTKDYRELLFWSPLPSAQATHFPEARAAKGPQSRLLISVRGDFKILPDDRKIFYIHELQSDTAQGLHKLAAHPATTAIPHGEYYSLYDAKDGGKPVGVILQGDLKPEEAVALHNAQVLETKKLLSHPYLKTTDAWAGVALRAVMRYAADNDASAIALSTAKEQDIITPTDSISVFENTLFIDSGTGQDAMSYEVNSPDDVYNAIFDHYKDARGVRLAERVVSAMTGASDEIISINPRAEGMEQFYGTVNKTGMLRKIAEHLNGEWQAENFETLQIPVIGGDIKAQAFPVKIKWRGKPVDYFSTSMPETFPELEELTAQVEQLGVLGEAKQMTRKSIATAWKMARALAAPQQYAFANQDVVGLQYHNKVANDMQAYRARLEQQATAVAKAWASLGKEQLAKLHRFLQEEYELGQHWAELQKGPNGWELLPSETFAAKAQEHGLSESTAGLALKAKNEMMRHANALERLLAAKAMRRYKGHSMALKKKLSDISQMFTGIRAQPFLPQSRFGEFGVQVVEYTMEGEELMHQEFFQTEEQRDEAVGLLQKRLSSRKYRVEAKNWRNGIHAYKNIPPEILSTIAQELDMTEGQQEQLLAMLDKSREAQTLRKFSRELANVTGRNRDLLRNFGDFMRHDSALLAKLRYREEFARAAQAVERDIALLDAEPVKGQEYLQKRQRLETVLGVMQEHSDYILNPREEWQALKTTVVLWQLWGVAKTAIANLTALMPVVADLTAHFGTVNGVKALSLAGAKTGVSALQYLNKAGRKILGMQVEDARGHLTDDEIWALDKAKHNGVLDQTFSAQLADFSDAGVLQRLAGSQVNNYAQLVKRMGMLPIHLAELYTRNVALLAKFNLYMEAGVPREEAYELAAEEMKLVVGDSSRINRPPFMRGRKAAFTIYYSFTQLMMYLFSGQYEKGYAKRQKELELKGYKVRVRKQALTGMTARMWLMFLFAGGLGGAPGGEDLRAVLRMIAQKFFGKDFDLELETRRMIKELNDSAEDYGLHVDPNMVMHGLAHNIGGFDLSGSVGFGKVVPGLATLGESSSDPMDTALAGAGPLGGFVSGFLRALTQQQPSVALQIAPALPSVARNAVMASDWAQNGVRYKSGGAVVRDLETGEVRDLTTGELLMKGIGGFHPTAVSAARDKHYAVTDAKMFWMERRTVLYADMATALRAGDREAIADTTQTILQYNKDSPPGMQVSLKQLRSSMKGRKRAEVLDTLGIPKEKDARPLASEIDGLY